MIVSTREINSTIERMRRTEGACRERLRETLREMLAVLERRARREEQRDRDRIRVALWLTK